MNATITHPDVVLVGAAIMSVTLGTLLKQLQPGLTMEIFESLDSVAGEPGITPLPAMPRCVSSTTHRHGPLARL